ncbi:hypothetical protein [Bacillus phage vB_BceM_Bc431v3]|uniref:Uncharacterized protein n=1 Tax=Bacillus phage vB_BceM_Bc431v3 TaxID=1195072 RepID=M4HPC4_9CAUD|nr:hypothetical protein K201_gp149 [Bacillus phage vB_BceM_Bc431v3]AFQ96457.1 hypothetical protein [Bacillus phage vB_BceM_Bc431v3]
MGVNVAVKTFKVFKTPQGFLQDVWECWDEDVINHSFTDDPTKAMTFYGTMDYAPKYLWDFEKSVSIDTKAQMCEAFNGKFVTIQQKTTVEWKEI